MQAIVDGKLNCVVECNPLAGPVVYDAVAKVVAGQTVPRLSYNHDELFDASNAKAAVAGRQY